MATYEFWQNALKGEIGQITENEPQPGFYRKRTGKAKGYAPVALWEMDGKMVGVCDLQVIDPLEVWTYCCMHPITQDQYWNQVNTGAWHDEDLATTASLSPPPVGHNQGPTDPAEILSEQITAALAGVEAYAEVKDDETASKAQSLRSRLLELSREADGIRVKTKEPHLEAGRAVDTLYQPLVKNSKAGADTIAKALGAHETRKARAAAIEAQKAEETRRKAAGALQAKAPIGVIIEPEAAPMPVAAAPIKGAYGKAASVRVIKVVTVSEQQKVYEYFKDNLKLVALLHSLAQTFVDANFDVPGVTIEEQRKVV